MDRKGRELLIRAVCEAGTTPLAIIQRFLRNDGFADVDDYLDGVGVLHGPQARQDFEELLDELAARMTDERSLDWEGAASAGRARALPYALLLSMPEGDFLTALEVGAGQGTEPMTIARLPGYLTTLCERRGIPYKAEGIGAHLRFVWVGDTAVAQAALEPALGALDDPRLARGPKNEFAQAQREVRSNTPETRKQAVAEACNAVESTMKVVLQENGHPLPAPANAQNLFTALHDAGLASKDAEEILLGASRFGNRRGRHGAGKIEHLVTAAEARGVVAAAATAISMLAAELPPSGK